MNKGYISKEYYIGRFLYLKSELDKLPNAAFHHNGVNDVICIRNSNDRERITEKNPRWNEYMAIVAKRNELKASLKRLKEDWSKISSAPISREAEKYILSPNVDSEFDSKLWESFTANACTYEKEYRVNHNGIVMRSLFEAEVAQIIEDLGISYKYEVCLNCGRNDNIYPDVAMNFPEFNRCGFVEVMGMMDNPDYSYRNSDKFNKYARKKLYINRDVIIIPGDKKYRPEPKVIKQMIGVMVNSFACMYVLRRDGTSVSG